MKIYKVYLRGELIDTFTESGFKNWVNHKAERNCGLYRIIGDKQSSEFYIDLGKIYAIKAEEAK